MSSREDTAVRKVAVIAAVDVVGYSRLVEADEAGTVSRLTRLWSGSLRPLVEAEGGRIVKLMGDGALLEFPSAGSALDVIAKFGKEVMKAEGALPPEKRIAIRAGLHVGDVMVKDNDVYGHGVNIAARLEGLASPNGLCLSDTARSALGRRAPDGLSDLGAQRIKNIAEPVHVWAFTFAGDRSVQNQARRWPLIAGAIGALLSAFLGAVLLWQPQSLIVPGTPEAQDPSKGGNRASLVVLPFRNLSDDTQQDFFVDGITEDLILDLSRLSGLFVVSRNTAFSYRNHDMSDRAVAEELGVRYVMQGSVRRQYDRIRVNVEIVDTDSGSLLWGERYDEKVDDIFDVQDRLKLQIVEALPLDLGERQVLAEAPTDNLEAYEFYLRGRHARQQGDIRSMRLAYYAFEKAIELEPGFAEAIAALAELHADDFSGGTHPFDWERPPLISRDAAESLAKRAAAIAPASAAPEIALAHLRWAERRLDDALLHARRAVALEPQLAEAHVELARVLSTSGAHEEALEYLDEAFRLNPKGTADQYGVHALALFGKGDAQSAFKAAVEARNAADVSLSWRSELVGYAAAGYLSRVGDLPALNPFDQPSILTVVPVYEDEDDQARFVEGLEAAGLSVLHVDPPEGGLVSAATVGEVFMGRTLDGFCQFIENTMVLDVTRDGPLLWTPRHDFSLAGKGRVEDGHFCMRLTSLPHIRESCWAIYPNEPPAPFSKGHAWAMDGPLLCYVTPRQAKED